MAATSHDTIVQPTRVFTARALTKVYQVGDVRIEALRGVDFDLAPGEFVVLLGPSGSGKSTLLNILGGLDVPTTGEVAYADQNLTTATESALTGYRRAHVGFVFQFYNLIPSLTARENVALLTELVDRPMPPEDELAVRIPPAEAMRPEPPARYRRSLLEARWRPLRLSFAMRMVVRALERQRRKTPRKRAVWNQETDAAHEGTFHAGIFRHELDAGTGRRGRREA